MKKILLIFLIILLPIAAYSYTSNWRSFSSAATSRTSSSAYIGIFNVGVLSPGLSTSAGNTSVAGFLAGIFAAGDIGGPKIENVKVDGREVRAGDYVMNNGQISATVTDSSGVSTPESSVGYDTTTALFSTLTGDSSYVVSTGALTYKLNVSTDGDHTLKINAKDSLGNASSFEVSVKVDSGDTKASNVYAYPNPFNPNLGSMRLVYNLNKNANITIYIFNAINQPVWKMDYTSGAEGAHAGYNEVFWNGVTDFGEVAGNDIYFARLVADGKRVVGKVKIAVIK